MAESEWTYERALEEQANALRNGLVTSIRDTPLGRWLSARSLDQLRSEHVDGSPFALLVAIERCAVHGVPLPDWAAAAFSDACTKIRRHEAASWDEALGIPHPKGQHVNDRSRARLSKRLVVYERVRKLGRLGKSITDDLFEEVGLEFGVSTAVCKNMYGEIAAELRKMQRQLEK